ncbi:hypothetical protein EK21DRAFT_85443 [Setomelanomma holmii]|uniref:Uncharacterized protein n=1 Tax=Setomelanomma holmii TaxID=210430 RepID=A0A9P4HK04_9PLEO|nr:hypothetical protein EK21DRAFT_85443 [Setomelanomma holmii]
MPMLTLPTDMPANPLLNTFKLIAVSLDAGVLERLVESPYLANLQILRVKECSQIEQPNDILADWNMDELIRALDTFIPQLEPYEPDDVYSLNLYSDVITSLRCAAGEFTEVGTRLQVHRCPGYWDKRRGLLVEPCFTWQYLFPPLRRPILEEYEWVLSLWADYSKRYRDERHETSTGVLDAIREYCVAQRACFERSN